MSAAEAATAPSPSAGAARAVGSPGVRGQAAEAVREAARAGVKAQAGVKAHGPALGRSVLSPIKRFSSVLWLQVTGTFFAVFALFLGEGAWRARGAFAQTGSAEAHKGYFYLAVCVVFAYFAVSSFVRAGRRGRR